MIRLGHIGIAVMMSIAAGSFAQANGVGKATTDEPATKTIDAVQKSDKAVQKSRGHADKEAALDELRAAVGKAPGGGKDRSRSYGSSKPESSDNQLTGK